MASLAAVIAEDRSAVLAPGHLTGLLNALRALRGDGPVHREAAGSWAQVALVDGDVPGWRDAGDGGWHLAVGAPAVPGPLWRTPLADLDGIFAAIRHTAAGDVLEVLSDPFGLQALHHARRDGVHLFCTSALALARHLRAPPDPVGNALFLRTGVQYGPVTHWRGVERVEPGTVLRFQPSGARVETYFRPEVDPAIRRLGLHATVDRLVEAGLAAIEPLRQEPCVAADLTGGFDTRMVLAFLLARGIAFTTHTSGEPADIDVQIAREVAETAGVPWEREGLPPGWKLDAPALDAAVAWGDGTLDALQLGEVLYRQGERARRCGLVVAGVGGEHLSPFPWMQEFHRAGRTTAIHWDNLVRMRLLLPTDLRMFRRDPGLEAEPYVREVLARRAAPYAGEPNTTQHDVLYAYRGPSHSGAYRSAGEARVRVEAPFHTKAFFAVGFSADHHHRNGSKLHRGVIERLHPAIADLRTQRGGPAVLTRPGNVLRFRPYYTRLGRSAVRKLRRTPGTGHLLSAATVEGFRGAVTRAREAGQLDPATMHTGERYEPAALDAFVAASASPEFTGWAMLGRILTLELALRAAAPD